MFKWLNLKNVATFAMALAIGITCSYTNQAHAGILSDIFQEPINDFIALITKDLGNTMAILGVIAAIGIAVWYQSLMTGITLVATVGVLWAAMDKFA